MSVRSSAACLSICLLAMSAPSRGECRFDWKPGRGFPGVDDQVNALVEWDQDGEGPASSILVVAGLFEIAGDVRTHGLAYWDGEDWFDLGGGTDGVINALAVFEGKLIVGGSFNSAGDVPARNIAMWDGLTWNPLATGVDTEVHALIDWQGVLVAGSQFRSGATHPIQGVSRWDGYQWQRLGTLNISTRALSVFQGQLVAAGSISGPTLTLQQIAQWDGAQWRSMMGGMNGTVETLQVYAGELIAGGQFNSAGTAGVRNIARWNGTQWRSLATGFAEEVHRLTIHDDYLLAYGVVYDDYNPYYGLEKGVTAKWDGTEWTEFVSPVTPAWILGSKGVRAFAHHQGELIAAGGRDLSVPIGHLVSIGPAYRIARFDGGSWHRLGNQVTGVPRAFAELGGELYALGFFESQGPSIFAVGRWEDNDWRSVGVGVNGSESSMVAFHNGLAIARETCRLRPDGECCICPDRVDWWDGNKISQLGEEFGADVETLTVKNGTLLAGGSINPVAWNGIEWTSFANGLLANVIAVWADQIIAGTGQVREVRDEDGFWDLRVTGNAVRWDGNQWTGISGYVGFPVFSFLSHSGTLFLAGGYAYYSDHLDEYSYDGGVFRLRDNVWEPVGDLTGPVQAITAYNGDLIASGSFWSKGTEGLGSIARWDGVAWRSVGTPVEGSVYATQVHNGELFISGSFLTIGEHISHNTARYGRVGRLGDWSDEGELNLSDYREYPDCANGVEGSATYALPSADCRCVFNSDGDGDVDLRDFAALQNEFSRQP